jgi:hypothetical protein
MSYSHSFVSLLGPSWLWIVWKLDLQLPVQSVPITTNVVSSNPVNGEVYLIEHYVIMFDSDLRQVGGFFGTPVFFHQKK